MNLPSLKHVRACFRWYVGMGVCIPHTWGHPSVSKTKAQWQQLNLSLVSCVYIMDVCVCAWWIIERDLKEVKGVNLLHLECDILPHSSPLLFILLCATIHPDHSLSHSLTTEKQLSLYVFAFQLPGSQSTLGLKWLLAVFKATFLSGSLIFAQLYPDAVIFSLTARQFGLLGSHIRQTKQNTSDVFAQLSSASLL